MKKILFAIALVFGSATHTFAFCGFYVAQADATLFNTSSQVIIARDGNHTVITMSNNFKGEVDEFAMVIPVPVVLNKDDVKVVEKTLFDMLDRYSGPRMVEYHDPYISCPVPQKEDFAGDEVLLLDRMESYDVQNCAPISISRLEKKYQVKVKAKYNVEEYEIVILTAKKSTGLLQYLKLKGYQLPEGAEEVLEPYIKQDMKFFLVKVDKKKMRRKSDGSYDLRPLQISFNSPKFMLPIRLGMANANGDQDMLVYTLTKKGRVETTNYQTIEMPSNIDIPQNIKTTGKFNEMYKAAFDKKFYEHFGAGVFLEYAWDIGGNVPVKCDPCNGPPPVFVDLQKAGVNWISWNGNAYKGDIHFTRLHVRYNRELFPQDLVFQETPNKERFQCRYVVRNPASANTWECDKAQNYLIALHKRKEKEVQNLYGLTGWSGPEYDKYVSSYDHLIDKTRSASSGGTNDNRDSENVIPFLPFGSSGTAWPLYMLAAFLLLGFGWLLVRRWAYGWMMRGAMVAILIVATSSGAHAFCGFYVAQANTKLFNKSSEVIYVRYQDRSVITMSNDFQGNASDFAMVVPVPEVLKREQIRVVEGELFSKFDAYSGPRMVEYYDQYPCPMYDGFFGDEEDASVTGSFLGGNSNGINMQDLKNKVTVEARYDVGEYDVLILSAEESDGLENWLTANGYKIPQNAKEVLEPYIRNKMKFFVVKVDLEKVDKKGGKQILRPLQIEINSPKFMLPIRLGMANAKNTQDLVIYMFTPHGRVETINYRTVQIPTDRNIPLVLKEDGTFGQMYKDLFDKAYEEEGKNVVFTEYAWDISGWNNVKCDPCVGPPPIYTDLQKAGVNWISLQGNSGGFNGQLFFTRLHVRYDRERFPQDLVFQETQDVQRFQGRYVVHIPATTYGFNKDMMTSCPQWRDYLTTLRMRRKVEAEELEKLCGWNASQFDDYVQEYDAFLDIADENEDSQGVAPVTTGGGNGSMPLGGLLLIFALTVMVMILFRQYYKSFNLNIPSTS